MKKIKPPILPVRPSIKLIKNEKVLNIDNKKKKK